MPSVLASVFYTNLEIEASRIYSRSACAELDCPMGDRVRAAIDAFDGRHIAPLESVAATLPAQGELETIIAALSCSAREQAAATWILRAWLERGLRLRESHTRRVVEASERLTDWEVVLHVCQAVEHLDLEGQTLRRMWAVLLNGTRSDAKFVRAWSYNGLAVLGSRNSVLRDDAIAALERGSKDDAASVRARIRKAFAALERQED